MKDALKVHIKSNYKYYIILLALALMHIVLFFLCCAEDIINYDSSYQYFLTLHDFDEIFRLLPEDYSPPFYAVILKIWTMLFGETLIAMRSLSLVAMLGMAFIALFPVRAAFGNKTAIVSSLLFAFSSLNFTLIREIRPTVFAFFLVTAGAVYFYLSFFREYRYSYICMTVFSVLAMYTHNVGMLSMLSFYIIAIIFSICTKRYDKMRKYFISGAICAVVYIPWLIVVLKQFGNVLNNYWQGTDPTLSKILSWSVWSNFIGSENNILLLFVILLITAAVLIITFCKILNNSKKKNGEKTEKECKNPDIKQYLIKSLFVVLLFVGPVVTLVCFCEFVYPIITARSFYIFAGIALLIIALIIVHCDNKIVQFVFVGVISVNMALSVYNTKVLQDESDFSKMITYIDSDSEGQPAFLHSHEWTLGIFMYYFPDAKHYIYDGTWCVLNTYDVFSGEVIDIGAVENIKNYEDSFYVIDMHFPDTDEPVTDSLRRYEDFEFADCGVYTESYTFLKKWLLVKVESI